MIRQLGEWIGAFRESDLFKTEIPFTNGVTLGDAFDWSKGFLDSIYSKLLSVELQSSSLRGSGPFSGTLSNARFKLQFGDETPVELTVNGSYGVNPAVDDLDELAAILNAAFTAQSIAALF
jgi:hypothetical protein